MTYRPRRLLHPVNIDAPNTADLLHMGSVEDVESLTQPRVPKLFQLSEHRFFRGPAVVGRKCFKFMPIM